MTTTARSDRHPFDGNRWDSPCSTCGQSRWYGLHTTATPRPSTTHASFTPDGFCSACGIAQKVASGYPCEPGNTAAIESRVPSTDRRPVPTRTLTLYFLPFGWSEVETRTRTVHPGEDADYLATDLINECWDRGGDPVEVTLDGTTLWSSSRF